MKICVVGVGRWGKNYARVFSELKGEGVIDEFYVCDKNISRAREIALKYGADGYGDDAVATIRKNSIDAAVVAVPTVYHHRVSMELLPYVDLLIEKPIASSIKEAWEIVRETEKLERIVAVGHIERFNPAVIALKKYIESLRGEGDNPLYVSTQRIGPGPHPGKTDNLGVAHDLLIHDVDVVCYLLKALPSRVWSLTVYTESFPYETEIFAIFSYDAEEAITANLRASWRTSSTLKKRELFIQTRNSIIRLDYILQVISVEKGVAEHRSLEDYSEILSAYRSADYMERRLLTSHASEPLKLEVKDFINSIRRRKRPLVSALDGYIALKCVISALESSKRNEAVKIDWNEIRDFE